MKRQENSNIHGLLAATLRRSLRVKEEESRSTKLLKVALGLGVCAVLMLPFFAGRATAVDTVIATIRCPRETNVHLNWNDRIGRDPTFEYKGGTGGTYPRLISMEMEGQRISCRYQFTYFIEPLHPTYAGATYAYTVKRKIQSCTKPHPDVMECKLAR